MKTALYTGIVWHGRSWPVSHEFVYPIFHFAIDLDELGALESSYPLFALNRFGLFSIHEKEYLPHGEGSIKEKVIAILDQDAAVSRIVLITVPRYLGYVFNPVNFYLCLDPSECIVAVLAEVRNTFGETYTYKMVCKDRKNIAHAGPFHFDKRFYVSPFFDTSGSYELSVNSFSEKLQITVKLLREDKVVFTASMKEERKPYSPQALLRILVSFPLNAWLAMTRISLEALKIRFKRGIHVIQQNAGEDYQPMSRLPNWIHHLRRKIVNKWRYFGDSGNLE